MDIFRSRLTTYENEQGWDIYFPLLLFSIISTNEVFNHCLKIISGNDKPVKTDLNGRKQISI